MKKLVLTIATLVSVACGALAQGTVAFNNFLPSPWTGGLVWTNTTPGVTNGGALATAGFHVELLYGTVGSGIVTNSGRIFISANNGGQFFDGSVVNLAGIPGGSGSADATMNVALIIRGWTGAFATYDQAFAAALLGNSIVGQTAIFNNPTGGGGGPPAPAANLVSWLSSNPLVLAPVPEPSTFALCGLGAAAFLLLRRRKS